MSGINYVTKETLEQMKRDLNQLKSKGRAEIARAISEAREKGDLKENAEYDAAKEAQGLHEAKIAMLENAVVTARVVEANSIDTSKVSILCKVTITNMANKKTITYQLVSEQEADLKAGKISVSSPIGRGLLGKAVGDVALVQVPNGNMQFKIDEITV
ncbi:transcription elongation factor GreA [Chitinophaga costaii]|uniref:Transcription elongation factor GreA n=1 Tax=Chitinophaga costaii TaxID=1335309 RepID=A0A1C4F3E3_9BACT|nr:transcription elongation factor GreA [Chitinophaga costaii]PUZ22086.1 transcription elongation factor GreA [Chitinophaga costaii]SCC50559.1 transcription elongation factor GreA [Chitinophaga costaii]